MTTPFLAHDLEVEEGRRSHAYADPLTGGAPWTVGVGFTGPDIKADTVMTDLQIDAELDHRLEMICGQLDADISWWRTLSDERQDVLVQMAYQLGVSGLLQFKITLGSVKAGDYAAAAMGMMQSTWARQTPARALRLATQMRTGKRQYD